MPPPNHQLNRHLTANEPSRPLRSRAAMGQVSRKARGDGSAGCLPGDLGGLRRCLRGALRVKPVRNAAVNANVKTLVKRLGYEEAPLVAAWYVRCVNESL